MKNLPHGWISVMCWINTIYEELINAINLESYTLATVFCLTVKWNKRHASNTTCALIGVRHLLYLKELVCFVLCSFWLILSHMLIPCDVEEKYWNVYLYSSYLTWDGGISVCVRVQFFFFHYGRLLIYSFCYSVLSRTCAAFCRWLLLTHVVCSEGE